MHMFRLIALISAGLSDLAASDASAFALLVSCSAQRVPESFLGGAHFFFHGASIDRVALLLFG
jgi:hypothetical protein